MITFKEIFGKAETLPIEGRDKVEQYPNDQSAHQKFKKRRFKTVEKGINGEIYFCKVYGSNTSAQSQENIGGGIIYHKFIGNGKVKEHFVPQKEIGGNYGRYGRQ